MLPGWIRSKVEMSQASSARGDRREVWLAVGLVLLASALAFLPLAGKLGFYHDDWFTTASRVTGVPLTVMHSVDRPGMGVFYQAVSDLLGEAPIAWHLFAWAARAAGGLAFLWLARMLWPGQRAATTLMAVLFAVYPGFLQQPSANNYQNHLWAYSASVLSLALTVKAVRSTRWVAQVLLFLPALALAYAYPRVYEAMVGMEGLRFILIWYAMSGEQAYHFWNRLGRSLAWFAPFLLSAAYFVYWRLFIFQSLRYSVDAESLLDQYRYNFLGTNLRIVSGLVKDFFETVFAAWIVPLYQLGLDARYRYLLFGLALGLVVFVLVLVYARRVEQTAPAEQPHGTAWARSAVIIGGLGVLVTLLPVAFSGREVQFRSYLDRYTIQSILPAAMLLVGAAWLALRPGYRAYFVGGLAGLAVCTHLLNAGGYAANWEMQRQVWWQLSWRAPQIEPQTALIVQMPNAYRYPEGFEVWAPANRIYYPRGNPPTLTAEVLNAETLPDITVGAVVPRNFRLIEFEIDFGKALILSLPSSESCLHAMNRDFEISSSDAQLTREAARASRVEQIIPNGQGHTPPAVIFGREPAHEWCYYYQRADLARQRGDWQEVLRLGEEAAQLGYAASDPVEWVPFFEAYLHLDQLEGARRLAEIIRTAPDTAAGLCQKYLPDSSMVGYNGVQLLCDLP